MLEQLFIAIMICGAVAIIASLSRLVICERSAYPLNVIGYALLATGLVGLVAA